MAKAVVLATGRRFATIGSAKEYFAGILASVDLGIDFDGKDLSEIEAAYQAYCEATGWRLPSQPQSFYPVNSRGPGYTTRCFGVTYKDGSKSEFSMLKALSSIAK